MQTTKHAAAAHAADIQYYNNNIIIKFETYVATHVHLAGFIMSYRDYSSESNDSLGWDQLSEPVDSTFDGTFDDTFGGTVVTLMSDSDNEVELVRTKRNRGMYER